MLVGRQKELQAIDNALAALGDGQGGTLFMSGEPGIGKSTLARTLGNKARASGFSVYWGFCQESGGAPSYWPWTQLMRLLVSDSDIPEELGHNLGQLFPESTGNNKEQQLQPEQARFVLLESVRSLLNHISRTKPLVLVFDDLHSADADSLYLLQYLAKHANSMPVLFVGTYRELEARQSTTTESLWRASRDAHTLRLLRLDRRAVEEYLAAAGPADDDTVSDLLERTGGNPLFLTELVGLLDHQQGGQLPETVQQVIEQQLSLLPKQTVDTLGQASVLGREFRVPALAKLKNEDEGAIESLLEPAKTAGLINSTNPGQYRFSHVLHRDVLYHELGATSRQELHVQCAEQTRKHIDSGAKDRWSIYALHLHASGPDYREEAIAAWEKGAERAHDRAAFEDAAQCLQNALAAFGEGPRFDPVARCRLQLRCAHALLLAGNLNAGHRHCREVFASARTLEDPELMSQAALTYGNALVIARVDKELVAMLSESLDLLPSGATADRALVQARLAAALQPAVDPGKPMRMADEAITMAREINDEAVLFGVLRSGISALMDFASASDRIPLNREYGELAAKRGNVAEQFRSYLRLMIDAIEIADRQLFDESIDAAEQIADRIDLPHYLWRTESMRATQAITEGRFEQALELIARSQHYADRANDLESTITLPLQRFALSVDWDDERAPSMDEIEDQLQRAYAGGMAGAEFFVEPLLAVYSGRSGAAEVGNLMMNEAFIERAFKGGDRVTLAILGEFTARTGNHELSRRIYEQLRLRQDECCSFGLMGGGLFWPLAMSVGIIARGLGHMDDAREYLETALQIANKMQAVPVQAHIHIELAEIEAECGNNSAAQEHREIANAIAKKLNLQRISDRSAPTIPDIAAVPVGSRFTMHLDGDIRTVIFDGRSVSLRNNKGLQILAKLLAAPDMEIHVLDLLETRPAVDGGDAGPQLDDQARDEYRRRVGGLQEEIEEAATLGDTSRVDALQDELDFITRELSRAFGLGGRKRSSGSAAERARVNVRRRLKDAIERIGGHIPEAGRYLNNTIKTGTYCKYTPM